MKGKIVLLFFVICSSLYAQNDEQKLNSVFVEAAGTGGLYSLNFERLVPFNNHFGLSLSAGFSTLPLSWTLPITAMPVQIKSYYQFNKKHKIDIGTGCLPLYSYDFMSVNEYAVFLQAGYQYSFAHDKYYLGASFNPIIYLANYGFDFVPWAGLRFGYKLNNPSSATQKDEGYQMKNISGSIGFLNLKARIQYEKAWGNRKSYGATFTYYLWEFSGPKLEAFARIYSEKTGNTEGFFLQGKIGVAYLHALYDQFEKPLYGFTVGAGLACGYKIRLSNHLTLEPILGAHFYLPPFIGITTQSPYSDRTYTTERWYASTGLPLDFQLKFGWQK